MQIRQIIDACNQFRRKYTVPAVQLIAILLILVMLLTESPLVEKHAPWYALGMLGLILQFTFLTWERIDRSPKRVYPNEINENVDDYRKMVRDYVDLNPGKKARLIEFSSETATAVLDSLIGKNYTIQLLVAHPDSAPNEYQKERLQHRWSALEDKVAGYGSDRLQIRQYHQRAALRGRYIHNLVTVGWYTYESQWVERNRKDISPEVKRKRQPFEIVGHENPLICAETTTLEGKLLGDLFERVFNDLWSSANQEAAPAASASPSESAGAP